MRVKVGGKAIPASFLKIEGRGTLVGAIDQRESERRIHELVGGQNPGPKAPSMSKKGQEKREQWGCQQKSDCQGIDAER